MARAARLLRAVLREGALARAAALQFPPGVLFGSATAAYQVEGGLDNCNWREWEQRGKRADGHPTVEGGRGAGEACDMWNRFEEDLVHMQALGLAVYRFSVEGSRVEPEEGQFDDAALERTRSEGVLATPFVSIESPHRRRMSRFRPP